MTNKFNSFASLLGLAALHMSASLCFAEGEGSGDAGGGGTILGGRDAAPVDTGAGAGAEDSHSGNMYGADTGKTDEEKPKVEDEKPGDEKPKDEGKADDEKPAWEEYKPDSTKTDEENAALKAEHDKTKPADDKDEKKDDPVDPTSYEIDIPEGFKLDPTIDKEFRAFAAERKWSKEEVKELTAMQVRLYSKQSEAHAERVASWAEEIKTDKEIGGRAYEENCAKAREAKNAFFPPEADELLNKTGLGNHPAFVKGFARIGKAMGEMGTLPGKGKAANTSLLENLYGSE